MTRSYKHLFKFMIDKKIDKTWSFSTDREENK